MIKNAMPIALLLLAACGASSRAPAELPTANVRLSAPAPALLRPAAPPNPGLPSLSTPAASPAPSPATPLEQYRTWMAAAREQYPYPEPLEHMWALMICESSGQPDVVAGENYGLFQYNPATWAGEWNPYRGQPILDPQAQIFATAKAWYDGNQGWWGCY